MKIIRNYLLLILAIVLLAGCFRAGRIGGSDLMNLSLGMSKQEVVEVLGKPQSSSANESYEIYRYMQDHGSFRVSHHELIFVDGKLKLYGLANDRAFKADVEKLVKQR